MKTSYICPDGIHRPQGIAGGQIVSLVGSLEDLPLSDILQILSLSRRSGTLSLSAPEEQVVLRFRNGLISGLDLPGEESPLVGGLRRAGIVLPEILDQAIRECRRSSDSLLQTLAAKSYLDPLRIREIVVAEVRSVLKRLLRLEKGDFCFDLREEPEERSDRGIAGRLPGGPRDRQGDGTLLRIPEGLDPREILLEEMAALGEGSAYHFFLPALRRALPRNSEQSAAPSEGAESTAIPLKEPVGRVVLVDERSVYRDLLAAAWRKEEYSVDCFAVPEAGYQRFAALAANGSPVSLVTDLVLPETGGSGYAGGLTLLIRARQEFPEARVILMSEGVDDTAEEVARSLGARGILQKPVALPADAEGLRRAVDNLARNGIHLFQDSDLAPVPGPTDGENTETIRVVDQLSLLGGLLGELHRPGGELEIPLLVLRLAAEYFERGMLLAVREQVARGLGGFVGGAEGEPLSQQCRDLALRLAPGSRLSEVVAGKTSLRGPLEHPEELRLLEHLGGGSPAEAILLPLLSRDQVVAVLYGDNGESTAPVGDTRGLEIFLGEVGLALEKSLRLGADSRESASGP